jgi:AraC family transcriptional regulator of adaptative response / DNA-3-methyladenine glycosylase II
VPIDAATAYKALRARDRRFDGLFFVAVKTTGIYCRPICPARVPGRDRCEFFVLSAEAERAGFRACLRCRPELAPGHASIDATSAHLRTAIARIDAGYLNRHSVDELAGGLGITARHLRRAMEAEFGVSPVELAQTKRLAVAKQLLHDTSLPLTDVALASGFSSLRRFNSAFRERFQRPPTAIRRMQRATDDAGAIRLRLDYRPPFSWDHTLGFLRMRAIPGVEHFEGDTYRRSVSLGGHHGTVSVRPHGDRLEAMISPPLASELVQVVSRLRQLFDLDARPDLINHTLGKDAKLRASVRRTPGLRVPGAFDGFEIAIRAVLGQRISVKAATTLAWRLVERYGAPFESGDPHINRLFPTAEILAAADPEQIRALGLPLARAQTIIELSKALLGGAVPLERTSDPDRTMERLQKIPGIGPWTAQYITMRALRWPDAFPAGDLVVCQRLGVKTAKAAEARAESWRPWRSYAVLHLWSLP